MIMSTHDQADRLRIAVLQGSVRSERVGPAVAEWAIDPFESGIVPMAAAWLVAIIAIRDRRPITPTGNETAAAQPVADR